MARTIGDKTFLETLERVCRNAGSAGESIVKRDLETFDKTKREHTREIKKLAPDYKKSVKAVKELAGIRKLIPGGKSELIEMAAASAVATIDTVQGFKASLILADEKLASTKDNEKDLEEAKKHADKEFESVRTLLKKKFITEIRYESGVGMFWKYPPMVYKMEDGRELFLGYPEAGLSETNQNGLSVRLPSYKVDGAIGTYHMRHSEDGNDYCLGGYDEILKILAAKRQVTSLIRMFREYFLSCNKNSKHNTPNIGAMDLSLPKVIDDSWVVWKKANPGYKIAKAPPMVVYAALCDGCGLVAGTCECNGDGDGD